MKSDSSQDITIKIAFNLNYIGKLPDFDLDIWRDFNGTYQNFDLEPSEIMDLIYRGHAFTTHHHTYRKRDNFICGQHLALDFDTDDINSTFLGILRHEFIRQYAYALYTTPSYTSKTPRARALFLLDRAECEMLKYQELAEGLVYMFGQTIDRKCKDACRIFFGTSGKPDARMKIIGNILPLAVAQLKIAEPYRIHRRLTQPKPRNTEIVLPENANGEFTLIKNELIGRILSCPDNEKHYTLCTVGYTLGGYAGAGYIDTQSVEEEMTWAVSQRPTVKSVDAAKRTIHTMVNRGTAQPLYLEVKREPPKTLADAGIKF